ncbi:MAG: CapA family protein [Turicibacter sp.]|nr:CapA family protein [Turicibacter sp.]
MAKNKGKNRARKHNAKKRINEQAVNKSVEMIEEASMDQLETELEHQTEDNSVVEDQLEAEVGNEATEESIVEAEREVADEPIVEAADETAVENKPKTKPANKAKDKSAAKAESTSEDKSEKKAKPGKKPMTRVKMGERAAKAKYEAAKKRSVEWKKRRHLKQRITLAAFAVLLLVGGGVAFALNWEGSTDDGLLVEAPIETLPPATAAPTTPEVTEAPEAPTETPTEPEEDDIMLADAEAVRIQFAGDVFLHQGPIDAANTGGGTFDFIPFVTNIAPFVDGDLAIANMVAPVDAHGSNQNVGGLPNFNAPFEILEALQYAGFNHLISANIHSFDAGLSGLHNTIDSFDRAGIDHTGINANAADFNTPTIIDVDGIQVGILSYADGFLGSLPDASLAYAARLFNSTNLNDVPRMAQDIEELRDAGAEVVIVALYWGQQFGNAPTNMQRSIAEELSEAGADVIMGQRSHTVHPVEWHYRADGSRTLIMYSLGNFIADQTRLFGPGASSPEEVTYTGWNDAASANFAGRTQFGMLVTLEVERDENGEIVLGTVDVLPTLAMRDFTGNTLGSANDVSVLPLIDGEIPAFVTDESIRNWGRMAYDHVVSIVGEEIVNTTRE